MNDIIYLGTGTGSKGTTTTRAYAECEIRGWLQDYAQQNRRVAPTEVQDANTSPAAERRLLMNSTKEQLIGTVYHQFASMAFNPNNKTTDPDGAKREATRALTDMTWIDKATNVIVPNEILLEGLRVWHGWLDTIEETLDSTGQDRGFRTVFGTVLATELYLEGELFGGVRTTQADLVCSVASSDIEFMRQFWEIDVTEPGDYAVDHKTGGRRMGNQESLDKLSFQYPITAGLLHVPGVREVQGTIVHHVIKTKKVQAFSAYMPYGETEQEQLKWFLEQSDRARSKQHNDHSLFPNYARCEGMYGVVCPYAGHQCDRLPTSIGDLKERAAAFHNKPDADEFMD